MLKVLLRIVLILLVGIWLPILAFWGYESLSPLPEGKWNVVDYLSYKVPDGALPVVYSDNYNIRFYGLEEVHPFDTRKYEKVFNKLKMQGLLDNNNILSPEFPAEEVLRKVHTEQFLHSLKDSEVVAHIAEVPLLAMLSDNLVYRNFVVPQIYALSGTALATQAALQKGWAINIGGGLHHAHRNGASGFCMVSDIALSVFVARHSPQKIQRIMILDLDAHQGNGHGRDFGDDPDVFIVDMYNSFIFPNDIHGMRGVDVDIHLKHMVDDEYYLAKLSDTLDEAFMRFQPELIIYNAGTDILKGDPLGMLNISSNGVIARDEMVFAAARKQQVPIMMLTSGGYQQNNAAVIAESIINLSAKNLAF